MISKMVEIRDRGTFIPALAIQLGSDNEAERWLLAKAGFGRDKAAQSEYILLCKIVGGNPMACTTDPFQWGQNPRTYFIAHRYIQKHFDDLEPGAVICVETIAGERSQPKVSERLREAEYLARLAQE